MLVNTASSKMNGARECSFYCRFLEKACILGGKVGVPRWVLNVMAPWPTMTLQQ